MAEMKNYHMNLDNKKIKYRSIEFVENDIFIVSHEPKGIYYEFTGFKDINGEEIYDQDYLTDTVETEEGIVQSKVQVFWHQETGSWRLDCSLCLDRTHHYSLSGQLKEFKFEILNVKKLKTMDILQKIMIDLEELQPEDYINQEPERAYKSDYERGFIEAINIALALISDEQETTH